MNIEKGPVQNVIPLENDFLLRRGRMRAYARRRRRTHAWRMTAGVVALLLVSVGLSAALLSPGGEDGPLAPISGEFLVNTYTPDDQTWPKTARANDGTSVVVWTSWLQDGSSWGVYGRVYDGSGTALTSEFQVNTATIGDQGGGGGGGSLDVAICNVQLSMNSTFVVVWANESTGDPYDVMVQVYNFSALGGLDPVGTNFLANTYTQGSQGDPMVLLSVDMTRRCKSGVVTWGTLGETGTDPHDDPTGDIMAREFMFDAQGLFSWDDPSEWLVNTNRTNNQHDPEVSMGTGISDYVICWTWQTALGTDVMARRFTWTPGQGAAAIDAADFNVSDVTLPVEDYEPTCSMLDTGDFVVGWTTNMNAGTSGLDVYASAYDAARTRYFYGVTTNYTAGDQSEPSLSSNGTDTWTWTWTSDGQDGSYKGIYGWMATPLGGYRGDEFLVPSVTSGNQTRSDVAMGSDGYYIVAWATEGSPTNISARMFDNLPMVGELGPGGTAGVLAAMVASVLVLTHAHRPSRRRGGR